MGHTPYLPPEGIEEFKCFGIVKAPIIVLVK